MRKAMAIAAAASLIGGVSGSLMLGPLPAVTTHPATTFGPIAPGMSGGGSVVCPAGMEVQGGGYAVSPSGSVSYWDVEYWVQSDRPIKAIEAYDVAVFNKSASGVPLAVTVWAVCD